MDKRYRPDLTDAGRPATVDVPAIDEHGAVRQVAIAGEHPLTIYVDKQELLTIMTLGGAPEALTIGYLRNQRLVDSLQDIVSVHVDWEVNAVSVRTRNGLADLEEKTAKRTKTTGCGQGTVFGDLMKDVDAIRLGGESTLAQSTLYALLDRVRTYDTIYKQAGAVHGCALATNSPDDVRDEGASVEFHEPLVRVAHSPAASAGKHDAGDVSLRDRHREETGRRR